MMGDIVIGELKEIYRKVKNSTKRIKETTYLKLEETYKEIKNNVKKAVAGAMIGLATLYGVNTISKANAAEIITYMTHFEPYELYIPPKEGEPSEKSRGLWENVWYIGPNITIMFAKISSLPETYRYYLNVVDAIDIRGEGAFDIAYYPEKDEIKIFPKNGDTYNPGDGFNIIRWLVDIYSPQTYIGEDGIRLKFQEFPYEIHAKFPGEEDWRVVTGEIPLPLPKEGTEPVPEPATYLLVGSGILVVVHYARGAGKRKDKNK